jgi:peptidoglycan/LPS O-acetylase OafA/YrhL
VRAAERDRASLRDPGETRVLPHLAQLDGVRAIAVLLVLVHHFVPKMPRLPPLGITGVGIFFVLSGFLITRILLQCRLEHHRHRTSRGSLLGRFYIRRALRILPLYYLVLLILGILNVTNIRQRIWWHVGYLANVYFSYVDLSSYARERHFWSLAVEEQFYLVWPLLILFVPRRHLRWVVLATIAIAPIWRFAQPFHVRGSQANEWLTPPCADLLGMGALLAMCSVSGFGLTGAREVVLKLGKFVGLPVLGLYFALHVFDVGQHVRNRTHYTVTALAAAWLIGRSADGFRGMFGRFLSAAPMVYTGRISYGLYVWHPFVAALVFWTVRRLGWPVPRAWEMFLAALMASYLVATVSWYALERPVNSVKRFFEYR